MILLVTVLVTLTVLGLLSYPTICMRFEASAPRRLLKGDSWTYKVLFPDSRSYELTKTVLEVTHVNGTETYVLLQDDRQHISTQYLWITLDWHEIKAFKPHIGNLLANSTAIYSPPLEIFHLPFRVGDSWNINSTIQTTTEFVTGKIESTERILESRQTVGIGEISTPAGRFRTFKVTVTSSNAISEILWFDTKLGQVVYGEFYDQNEKVTQTLLDFVFASPASSATSLISKFLLSTKNLVRCSPSFSFVVSYIY